MTVETDALGFEAPASLGHPGRAGLPPGHPTGPEVGERLPDFELPDQTGRRIRFHEHRGTARRPWSSALASECHPLEQRSATLEATVRYQACDDRTCGG